MYGIYLSYLFPYGIFHRKLLKQQFLLGAAAFFLLSSCSFDRSPLVKSEEQMKIISSILEQVHSVAELQEKELVLKEHYLLLADSFVELRKEGFEEQAPSNAAEHLKEQLQRLYEIDGMRYEMERIQQPALEVFASFDSLHNSSK